jgi:hypothetical protein
MRGQAQFADEASHIASFRPPILPLTFQRARRSVSKGDVYAPYATIYSPFPLYSAL